MKRFGESGLVAIVPALSLFRLSFASTSPLRWTRFNLLHRASHSHFFMTTAVRGTEREGSPARGVRGAPPRPRGPPEAGTGSYPRSVPREETAGLDATIPHTVCLHTVCLLAAYARTLQVASLQTESPCPPNNQNTQLQRSRQH